MDQCTCGKPIKRECWICSSSWTDIAGKADCHEHYCDYITYIVASDLIHPDEVNDSHLCEICNDIYEMEYKGLGLGYIFVKKSCKKIN